MRTSKFGKFFRPTLLAGVALALLCLQAMPAAAGGASPPTEGQVPEQQLSEAQMAEVQVPAAQKLGETVSFHVGHWQMGPQPVVPIYQPSGVKGPQGHIDAQHQVTLPLQKPPAQALRPLTDLALMADLWTPPCTAENYADIQISDPTATFVVVNEFAAVELPEGAARYGGISYNTQVVPLWGRHGPLFYTGKPVHLQGHTICHGWLYGGKDEHFDVDLYLPGGWVQAILDIRVRPEGGRNFTLTNSDLPEVFWDESLPEHLWDDYFSPESSE